MLKSQLVSDVSEFVEMYCALGHDDQQKLIGVILGIKLARESSNSKISNKQDDKKAG